MLRKLILIVLSLFMASYGFASTTGKIAGRVVDAKTGEPLPGAQVIIEGTQFGAATDNDGYYFIINLRPGSYTVKASMIGYGSVRKTGVMVVVDRTTTINFKLKQTVLSGKSVTVVAERPVIQKDVSATEAIVSPATIQNNNYKTVADVLAAQTGILGFGALATRPLLRGSSFENAQFQIDGMAVVDDISNKPYMKINLSAVKEMQVVTGGFNAEYGNVRSGLINVITKEGTNHYTGSLDFKYSKGHLKHFGPQIYGKNSPIVLPFVSEKYGAFSGVQADGSPNYMFPGWEKYANSGDYLKPGDPHYGKPYEALALYLWRHRSLDNLNILRQLVKEGKVKADLSKVTDDDAVFNYGHTPDWVGEATFGGPIPFTHKKVKFFLSHRQEQTAYAVTTPVDAYNDRLTTLKLTTNITPSMKLTFDGLAAWQKGTNGGQGPGIGDAITNNPYTDHNRGFFGDVQDEMTSANKIWYPHCNTPGEQWRYSFGFRFTHQLSPSTYYEVILNSMQTIEQLDRRMRNTIKIKNNPWHATNLLYGRLGTEEEIQQHIANGDYDWENWRNYAKIKIGDYWYDEGPWGYGPTQWRDLTGYYRMASCNLQENTSVYHYHTLKSNITSQINRYNQVKAGFNLKFDSIRMKWVRVDPAVNGGRVYSGGLHGIVRPITGGVFVQDKLEFSGMIANLGIRWDFQARDKGISQNGPPDDPKTGPFTPYLQAGCMDHLDSLNWKRKFVSMFSPRIGISHPISENAKIFFNYGHFYRWPSDYDLYFMRFKTTQGNRMEQMGNVNLKPPRTIQYEIGYAQNLFNIVRLTATGYYKDISDETFQARFYPKEGRDVRWYINGIYRDIRGIELRADARYTRFLNGYISYDHMISSMGYYGFDRFYQDPTKENHRVSTGVTQPKARPVFKVNLDFHTPSEWGYHIAGIPVFGGLDLGLLYYWRAGETFTWNPQAIPYLEDNVRWRPYQRTDLRFRKRLFKKWNIEPEFYIDVFNLFNNKNMSHPGAYYYTTENFTKVLTGVRNTWAWDGHKWWQNEFINYMYSLKLDKGDRPGDYRTKDKPYIKMPGFTPWTFLEKRQVFFGIRINFE